MIAARWRARAITPVRSQAAQLCGSTPARRAASWVDALFRLEAAVDLFEPDSPVEALGIPACCRAHFAAHWEEARERFEGDLLAWSLDARGHESEAAAAEGTDDALLPWQTNAFAMVAGAGLT